MSIEMAKLEEIKQAAMDGRCIAYNPKTMLALIAEVEQLQGKKALCKLHEKDTCLQCMWPPRERSEVAALKAEVETLTAAAQALRDEWRKDQAEVERLTAELYEAKEFQPIGEACLSNRDTLRESLGLKLGEHLHDHVEALRKDAERYRWLRVNEFDIGSYHPEGDHNHESWFEHLDDQSIDRCIADEAEFAAESMGKGEKV